MEWGSCYHVHFFKYSVSEKQQEKEKILEFVLNIFSDIFHVYKFSCDLMINILDRWSSYIENLNN